MPKGPTPFRRSHPPRSRHLEPLSEQSGGALCLLDRERARCLRLGGALALLPPHVRRGEGARRPTLAYPKGRPHPQDPKRAAPSP